MCGGTKGLMQCLDCKEGLSPRVRGNLDKFLASDGTLRSIPACAGEPHCRPATPARSRVYPRVCGGTEMPAGYTLSVGGLSPRVRGNRTLAHSSITLMRSIPACAGEPGLFPLRAPCAMVYPRVCGGTVRVVQDACRPRGLSPRVRGNQKSLRGECNQMRSIPACAGEPRISQA